MSVDVSQLAERISLLGDIEQAIIARIVSRLEKGKADYGDWKRDDSRNLRREALEEVLDCQVYCAAELLKHEED